MAYSDGGRHGILVFTTLNHPNVFTTLKNSKKSKDAGAVGPRGFSSKERRPSHISLSGQPQGELKVLSYTKL